MQDYRNLQVWQQAHQLAVNAYALPAYLQEPNPLQHRGGRGPGFRSRLCQILVDSMGSCNEFESDLLLGGDVKLIPGRP